MEEKEQKLRFIDFVLSIADDDLPYDNSIKMDMIQFRLDELEEQFDCLDDRLDIIENKINHIIKLLTENKI
jgi:hypothetical protein